MSSFRELSSSPEMDRLDMAFKSQNGKLAEVMDSPDVQGVLAINGIIAVKAHEIMSTYTPSPIYQTIRDGFNSRVQLIDQAFKSLNGNRSELVSRYDEKRPEALLEAVPMEEAETNGQPQHLQALAYGNHVRMARAALKRCMKDDDLEPTEVIQHIPRDMEGMSISELLRAQTRWGRTRARKFLMSMHVHENREVGKLSERQRGIITASLAAKAAS